MCEKCDAEVKQILGDEMFDKLTQLSEQYVLEHRRQLVDSERCTLKERFEQLEEFLKEPTAHLTTEQSSKVTTYTCKRYVDDALFAMLQAASALASVNKLSISEFLIEATVCYEGELAAKQIETQKMLEELSQSESLHHMARTTTGSHN